MKKLVVIGGHTASGKTAIGLEICDMLGTEIVSADSMLVYKYMDIGTAKPSAEQQARARHYMIDVTEPWNDYTVSDYYKEAVSHIEDIGSRGRLPLVVGGTGFYINALINGMYKSPKARPEIKEKLELRLKNGETTQELHRELMSVDPGSAARVHPNDRYRILRALGVYYSTGTTMSYFREQHAAAPDMENILFIVLRLEKDELRRRVEQRTCDMLSLGLEDEVKALLSMGCTADTKSMKSIGYKQMVSYLAEKTGLDEAREGIVRETLALAKRQNTWFKGRRGTRFYNPSAEMAVILDEIKRFTGF